jgi:DNA-binding CsgD family transcriptional regulator
MPDSIHATLGTFDMQRAVAAFQDIAAVDSDYGSFAGHTLDRLAELVGSDLTTLSLCDLGRQTRSVVGRRGEQLSTEDRAAFDRHFSDHPLVRYHSSHPRGATQRVTDCMSFVSFQDSPVFADYYRAIGIRHVMALPLRIDGANVISVVMNRSGSDFSDADRAIADMLRQPLASLYRGLMAREEARLMQASLQGIASSGGWHRVTLRQDGRLADIAPQASLILRQFFGDAPRGERGEAPAALGEWLHDRARNWGLDRFRASAAGPYVAHRDGRTLVIHFIADPLAPERGELLMRQRQDSVGPDALASLPLTRREREVVALVAAGKTNADIGELLALSPRTVQKHLEHVFTKLGVETRTAAAARAIAAARTQQ